MSKKVVVHLDLEEIVSIEHPVMLGSRNSNRTFGISGKGEVYDSDKLRPTRVLGRVAAKYKALADLVEIKLGKGKGASRLLKASYAVGSSDKQVGRAAQALSRKKGEKFTADNAADKKNRVSGYVYEGALLVQMSEHVVEEFKGTHIENVFATSLAHELGHNLGLEHNHKDPTDIMFVYAGRSDAEIRQWMKAAAADELKFKPSQIEHTRQTMAE
jgi:hypothetical protein